MLLASFPSSLCKNRSLFLSLRQEQTYLAIKALHPFPCFLRKLCKTHTHFCIMDPVYISHGSPMLPLEDIPARDFLRRWRELMPEKPKAILAVSAHWNTTHPAVSATARNTTIHDFYGFPPDLYKLQYNALGAPELARQVKDLLQSAGFNPVQEDAKRGLDHGAWVPLFLMYPDADIPVCQLSVQPYKDGRHHYELGRALASLRNEGVLIMASGSATHNLRSISSDNSTPAWATSFDDWLNESLINGRFEDVIEFEKNAPNARKAHPSPEHFYPLLVALGAAGDDAEAQRIHSSWAHSSLSMACFNFKPAMIQKFKELSENPRSVGGSKERSENPGSVGVSKELSGNPRSLGGSKEPSYKGNFLQKFLVRILRRHV